MVTEVTTPLGARLPKVDRWFWVVISVATVVLVVRGALIMREHSEIMDSQFHLRSGVALWTGNPGEVRVGGNDAPLGQMLMALTMVITGQTPEKPINDATWPAGAIKPGEDVDPARAEWFRTVRKASLYGNRWSARTILMVIAAWKSLLFVPAIAVTFQWCRAIYGLRSALVASAMVLVDPTFAAHVPILALDTLGVEGIVIACFCLWRYFERPSARALVTASIAMAVAVMLKHTAVIVPGVACVMAAFYWRGDWRTAWRVRLNAALLSALICCLSIWALTGFDLSVPSEQYISNSTNRVCDVPWPAGVYVGRFVSGFLTSGGEHLAFLWGETKANGWWYYFPALATYKVPIGLAIVIVMGTASFAWGKWRRAELSIVIPLLAWASLLMTSHLNIGFRHFLPAYVFVLMLSTRCVASGPKWVTAIAWAGVLGAAVHVASWHPDYLSYLNFPRQRWWMQITESNVDWGQALGQAGKWIDDHPELRGREIFIAPRWDGSPVSIQHYIGDRAVLRNRGEPAPSSGILMISPIWVTGVYDEPGKNPYGFLQAMEPIDVIGRALLVYDLDAKR